jgi:hypothetical protein
MIPFDLERAKKGVPMRTRDDRKAIFVSLLNGGQPAPLLIEVWDNHDEDDDELDEDGDPIPADEEPMGVLENYYIDGRHGTVHDSELDLFMEY